MIVLNDAKVAGAGFGVDTNRVTFLRRGVVEPFVVTALVSPGREGAGQVS